MKDLGRIYIWNPTIYGCKLIAEGAFWVLKQIGKIIEWILKNVIEPPIKAIADFS